MKLSRNWLERYLQVPYDDNELSEILTTIGLEVEGVERVEAIKGGLQGVVVGQITSCEKHPNADSLSVTTVDIGGEENLNIVCGAPNVAEGHKVLIATVGTTIYMSDGSFKIKKAKIRGVASEGMICAEDELGLGTSHDGIMVLDSDIQIGKEAAELFDLTTDTVFDIGLTPNRSDAMCQFGVAKDLFAYMKINSEDYPSLREPNSSDFQIMQTTDKIQVKVENVKACPRYTGLVISGMTMGPSPSWMQKLLVSVGVKPINAVVDVTNYILHEMGQPLHAFDADKIGGGEVLVKNLPAKTKFNALDDRMFELKEEDLIICDGASKGMCIAGVFGGKDSGVTDSTTKIFLESAYFDAGTIRRTSMKHNLRTDAAKVFEKGADPNICLSALKRAAMFICEITGGIVSSEIIDEYPSPIKPKDVRVQYSKVKRVIGQDLDESCIHDILNALDMEISPIDSDSIKVKVPTNKFDVTRDVDVIEEILRIYGFNEVKIPTVVKSTINYSEHPNKNDVKNQIGDYLAASGYNEMMGFSQMESRLCNEWLGVEEKDLIMVNNTSNVHLDAMRPDMLISGCTTIIHNINRKQANLKLFEFGKTYKKDESGYIEEEFVTLFVTGRDKLDTWNQKEELSTYYSIKSGVHTVLDRLGINGFQVKELEDDRFFYGLEYHRGPMAIVKLGQVSPKLLKKIGIKQDLYYAEFKVSEVIKALKNVNVSVQEISKYPSVKRDLALVLDRKVTFDQVESLARKTLKASVKDITLFDVFESVEHLGEGKKSYAVSFTFENLEKTLSDKEIEGMMKALIGKFEGKLNAVIRK